MNNDEMMLAFMVSVGLAQRSGAMSTNLGIMTASKHKIMIKSAAGWCLAAHPLGNRQATPSEEDMDIGIRPMPGIPDWVQMLDAIRRPKAGTIMRMDSTRSLRSERRWGSFVGASIVYSPQRLSKTV